MTEVVALRDFPPHVRKGRTYTVKERARDEYGEPVVSLVEVEADLGFPTDGFERKAQ